MEEKNIPQFDPKDIQENKAMAAISYIWILCFIPLLLKKDSKFAQAHGKQGLILFIVEILGFLVYWIPVIGLLVGLIILLVAIFAFIQAISGKYWEIPLVGQLAKKINL